MNKIIIAFFVYFTALANSLAAPPIQKKNPQSQTQPDCNKSVEISRMLKPKIYLISDVKYVSLLLINKDEKKPAK